MGFLAGHPLLTFLILVVIPILVIWEAVWKGIALWRAGNNHHLVWFICIFIFNTLGILEIIYIFVFSKKKDKNLPA